LLAAEAERLHGIVAQHLDAVPARRCERIVALASVAELTAEIGPHEAVKALEFVTVRMAAGAELAAAAPAGRA
jgi:hypothetical protein